jgi:hypothetical protein
MAPSFEGDNLARMKLAAMFLFLCLSASAEKMNVKVIQHTVGSSAFTQFRPGFSTVNSSASANCAAYGNSASCAGTGSTSGFSVPSRTVQGSLSDIFMTLLLPDGRTVDVACQDHFWGLSNNRHNCKNPMTDDLEADFSGDKVKLHWVAGIGGKKKDSETFSIMKIFPATAQAKP